MKASLVQLQNTVRVINVTRNPALKTVFSPREHFIKR